MKARMEAFATARFATHPDGRIAARLNPINSCPWAIPPEDGALSSWATDQFLADGLWSPLDESRPVVVTDEMVEAGARALQEHQNLDYSWDDASATVREWHRRLARPMLTAALSTAPTTDEDEALDIARAGKAHAERLRQDWQDAAEQMRERGERAEQREQEALDFAALWKETARKAVQTQRTYIGAARDERRARQTAEQTMARRERTIRLLNDTANDLGRQKVEAEDRAEKAERERDYWRGQVPLTEWEKDLIQDRPLTAREHLDKAWDAAHVPADGTIPAGAEFLWREADGTVFGPARSSYERRGSELGVERRLLDPPTPARPDGAEAAQQYLEGFLSSVEFARDIDAAWLADQLVETLAERGVRAPEDGTP